MSETDIVKGCLSALCKQYAGCGLFYRRNTGALETQLGFVRFGLPGMADIGGILDSTAYEIEIKTLKGIQSEAQKNWQRAVEKAGGVYILARSVDDCLKQVALCRERFATIHST
jgi:hypothetical protein